ncbi:hypothetical protein TNIN_292721 [Trichonephila inaurata madagascariensis]|uniref:Uncharacterized protein n=1 Tax=Trichonephila inaurata madagascariensis TaxID=2747483 RepID=A0A8X6YUT7_9ARAC|nr:hypothetical protein TNIN_292721 [Trichonephila inaurata madagascariensis]
MDQQLTTGTGLICEQHPTGNEMDQSFPPSTSTSRFGTPQLTNCQCRHQLALDFQYYTIAMENLKSNINSLRVNGLKDQSSHIMKKNQQRLADYTSLHQFPASEFTSLPNCEIPGCAEHHTPYSTPTKNNDLEFPPLPKTVSVKRKENSFLNSYPLPLANYPNS